MTKVVGINVVCNGSTGKIMKEIQKKANENGYETISLYGRRKGYNDLNSKKIGNNLSLLFHAFITFVFNKHNHGSYFTTKKMIKFLRQYKPDIIHIHNIHGYYLNNTVFFNYLNNDFKGKVIWTLHDCWSFTGHCSHFDYIKCDKWQKQCHNCPQKREYPYSWFFDTSYKEYQQKKKLYTNIKDLTIVVPSNWLKEKVQKSFFKDKECLVINNGIDLNVFKPNIDKKIYNKYNIPKDKKIILGVASVWTEKKGFNTFLELSNVISENEIIIMVGLNKKQMKNLPNNIIGIERTENIKDLVSLYTIADVFFNPSMEETFSLVTVESLACGTPCVVFNATATPELIDKKVGVIINNYDINNIYSNIRKLYNKEYKTECILKAQKYGIDNYDKYIDLYNELIKK